MNFKKLSITSVGLAVLLFSCAGKTELTKEQMQKEITDNFKLESIQTKYVAGKKVKVTGTINNEKINETFTLKDGCIKLDGNTHLIELGTEEDDYNMVILDSTTFNVFSAYGKFYKTGSGYLFSGTEGGYDGEVTFDKDFVSISAEQKMGDLTANINYTYLG